MHLLLPNDKIYIDLWSTEIGSIFQSRFKHLQHVDIPFNPWHDNPRVKDDASNLDKIIQLGSKFGISIDLEQIKKQDQQYLNYLHEIYETKYDGDSAWIKLHELIHWFEKRTYDKRFPQGVLIDYKSLGGPLNQIFQRRWDSLTTTKLRKGDVYTCWSELGKCPFYYWFSQEPNNIDRIKTLAKPWLVLRCCIRIALEDTIIDHDDETIEKFQNWWKIYHDEWCQHWNLESWSFNDIFGMIKIGEMPDVDRLDIAMQNQLKPLRLVL